MSADLKNLRIALVHDWLVSQRGGENVLAALCEMYPHAQVFTLVHVSGTTAPVIEERVPVQSWLGRIPGINRWYRHMLPLMPLAIRSLNLKGYDLIISSSHCVAKGVQVPEGVLHISYIHAPMRYMWDRFDEYFSADRAGFLIRTAAKVLRPLLKAWDVRSALGVHKFIANSKFIAGKVHEYYGRSAEVVYPLCDVQRFNRVERKVSDKKNAPYLIVTALVPYKRVDLAIQGARLLGRKLVVVGDGPERDRLMAMAGPETTFVGAASGKELENWYAQARALIFPGVEDFGIVPLEAMASGVPVVAYGAGGALETVIDGKTGLFFTEPTAASLADALNRLDEIEIKAEDCRAHAARFSPAAFKQKIAQIVNDELGD